MATEFEVRLRDIVAQDLESSSEQVRVLATGDEYLVLVSASAEMTPNNLVDASVRRHNALVKKIADLLKVRIRLVAVTGEIESRIEEWISTAINNHFPAKFEAVVATVGKNSSVDIWLVPNDSQIDLPTQDKNEVALICSRTLAPAGFVLAGIVIVGCEHDQPTLPVILRNMKISQPVSVEELFERLTGAQYRIPSQKWLKSQVDHLRQKELICFAAWPTGTGSILYALTSAGLNAIPPQTGRESSDILRSLALSSKSW